MLCWPPCPPGPKSATGAPGVRQPGLLSSEQLAPPFPVSRPLCTSCCQPAWSGSLPRSTPLSETFLHSLLPGEAVYRALCLSWEPSTGPLGDRACQRGCVQRAGAAPRKQAQPGAQGTCLPGVGLKVGRTATLCCGKCAPNLSGFPQGPSSPLFCSSTAGWKVVPQ